LEAVSTWVRAYFDTSDPNTEAFLDTLSELEKQPITLAIPTELKSPALLEKRVEKQIRNLLSQNNYAQPVAVEAQDAQVTESEITVKGGVQEGPADSPASSTTTPAQQGE
ncbi:uroporphyrinogen-III C-methyltransferase, partial [Pseudomonas aeruginosa]|uniref:uroporphyrinogen-III C-methyltransferase n=1 Tax=Pseudomonas aeruginosa TaxID=287 RepID=UPI000FEDAE15